jgi:uncharacterized protein YceK
MLKLIIRTILLLSFADCATVQTLPKSLAQDNPTIYSGFNTVWIEPSKTKGLLFDYDEMAGIVTLAIYILDTPFSIIADTLLLPVTFPLAIGKKIYYSQADNDPHLETSWSKHRGDGYASQGRKICSNLGMRLPTNIELEIAKSSGLFEKWNKCNYCNNIYVYENQNSSEKQELFGSIRCLRKGKDY